MTRYVLGIDGGSTKTLAVVADDLGRVLGVGLSGSSNVDEAGVAGTRDSLRTAAADAWRAAGLPEQPAQAAFLGLAGIVSGTDRSLVTTIAQELQLAADLGVDHDCRIALAGGLSGRPGMVLIAGTGSSCFGLNAAGERWLAGGWGHLISDEGSSYWLGLNGLRLAVGAFDGRWESTLPAAVQARLGLEAMPDIMQRLYVQGLTKAEIAALAPVVIRAAEAGDPSAASLIKEGMRQLAECVAAVARRLGWATDPSEVALAGGLFGAGESVTGPLQRAIRDLLPAGRCTPAELPPVLGAILLGLQRLSVESSESILSNLHLGVSVLEHRTHRP